MAATGLLGINPYQKGVAVDISSKPINLALQLDQKEQAKKEALDKYFMDYEKSINPAGVRNQEGKMFLDKLNQNKQFYLQNRDKILNPAKYGYDAQSQYMANFKDMINLIDQSKQAAGEEKAFKTYIDQIHKSGKAVDENQIIDILNNSRKPVGMGYVAPDATQIQPYDPHNPMTFLSKINALKRVEGSAKPEMLSKVTYQDVSPLSIDKNEAKTLAYSELSNTGYKKFIEHIAQDPSEVSRLSKFATIPDKNSPDFLPALSYAHVLSQAPNTYKRSDVKNTTPEQIRISLAKQKGSTALENVQNTVNYVKNGLGILQGDGDENAANDYFNYWRSQGKGELGGTVGFTDVKKVSPGVWQFNYNISKDGAAIPESTIIDANKPAAQNQLYALHQQFLGSNPKAEAAMVPKPSSAPKPSPKSETWAERQARLRKK